VHTWTSQRPLPDDSRIRIRLANATDNLDYPFLAIMTFCIFVGGMLGLVMAFSPRPPANEMVEIPGGQAT
jgi:hypothetical protein